MLSIPPPRPRVDNNDILLVAGFNYNLLAIATMYVVFMNKPLDIRSALSGVARPSWFPGLSEVITRAECPGLQGAWAIQYRSGALFCSF